MVQRQFHEGLTYDVNDIYTTVLPGRIRRLDERRYCEEYAEYSQFRYELVFAGRRPYICSRVHIRVREEGECSVLKSSPYGASGASRTPSRSCSYWIF